MCLLTFRIERSLSRLLEHLFMKNVKFALVSKGKVHSCGQKLEIYSTFIFMKNTPRKVSGDVLVPSYLVFANSP